MSLHHGELLASKLEKSSHSAHQPSGAVGRPFRAVMPGFRPACGGRSPPLRRRSATRQFCRAFPHVHTNGPPACPPLPHSPVVSANLKSYETCSCNRRGQNAVRGVSGPRSALAGGRGRREVPAQRPRGAGAGGVLLPGQLRRARPSSARTTWRPMFPRRWASTACPPRGLRRPAPRAARPSSTPGRKWPAGIYDIVMVVGVEKMTSQPTAARHRDSGGGGRLLGRDEGRHRPSPRYSP